MNEKIKMYTYYNRYAMFEKVGHHSTLKGAIIDGLQVVDVLRYDCQYQYNNGIDKYQDNEFYRLELTDGTYKYVYCKKPIYRITTDYAIMEVDYNDYFYIISKKHYLIIDELIAEDLEKNMLVQVNEYEDPQTIIGIEKIY